MSEPAELDATGLLCPMPVIRTQDRIKQLNPGDQLVVRATDPGTQQDIPAWCQVHGHHLDQVETIDDLYLFRITVAS